MFSFLFNCCGGPKTIDVFEQTRLACTKPNWEVPHKDDLTKMIKFMSVQDSENDNSIQLNSLLAHLQQDEQRKNVAYVLKNLIILDSIVEERILLKRISQYTNNQLIYMESQDSSNKLTTALKDLIGCYYIYIKQKAKYYQLQAKQMIDQNQRQKFMQKSNSITILNEINICFKIQNLILDASSKYKNGQKSNELIQYIFALFLKTYIFCHSIVAISLKVFVSKHSFILEKIPELTKHDLKYIRKLVVQYNSNYVRNFNNFILVNQQIPVYKQFQTKQIARAEQKIIQLIDIQLRQLQLNSEVIPQVEEIPKSQLNNQQRKQLNKLSADMIIKEKQIGSINSHNVNQGQIKNTKEDDQNQKQKTEEKLFSALTKLQTIKNQIAPTQLQKEEQKHKKIMIQQNYQKPYQNEVIEQPNQNHKQQKKSIQIYKIDQSIHDNIKKNLQSETQKEKQPEKKASFEQNTSQKPNPQQIQKQNKLQLPNSVQSHQSQTGQNKQQITQIKQSQNEKGEVKTQNSVQVIHKNEEINQEKSKFDKQKQKEVVSTLQKQLLQQKYENSVSVSDNQKNQMIQEKRIQKFQQQIEQEAPRQKLEVILPQKDRQSEVFTKYINTYYKSDWDEIYKSNQSTSQGPSSIMTPFQIAQYYNWNISPEQEQDQDQEQEQNQEQNDEHQAEQNEQQQQEEQQNNQIQSN